MRFFLYFVYYRFQQWSEKIEQNIPTMIALVWLSLLSMFHVCTVTSIITLISGFDAGYMFSLPKSRSDMALFSVVWAFLLWLILKIFRVREKAFSSAMIKKYEEKGFKSWWVWVYFFGSFAAMGVTTWLAGEKLCVPPNPGHIFAVNWVTLFG